MFVLSSVKNNLSSPSPSLSYRTVQAENKAVKLEWLGECPYDADELAAAAFEPVGSRKLANAVEWLRIRLAPASALSKVVEKEALEIGISPRTLARARKEPRETLPVSWRSADRLYGAIMDIVPGIIGAIVGGFIMRTLGFAGQSGIIYTISVAVTGTVILTWIVRLVKKS